MTGYTRIGTADQSPQLQLAALATAGVENRDVFVDETSYDCRRSMAVFRDCCVSYRMGFEKGWFRDTHVLILSAEAPLWHFCGGKTQVERILNPAGLSTSRRLACHLLSGREEGRQGWPRTVSRQANRASVRGGGR